MERARGLPGLLAGPAARALWGGLTLMKEFMMDMALELIPVSGCTCFSTL